MNDKEKIEALTLTFNNIQNLVILADSKASISLALQTFLVGFILGSSFVSGIFVKLNQNKSNELVIIFYALLYLL